jgi:DNA (cytosine-5)-methyltransferase 1
MTAYYNEIEPYAVQWLRNLIDAGLIAKGHVDDQVGAIFVKATQN